MKETTADIPKSNLYRFQNLIWFMGGFLACFVISSTVSLIMALKMPYGSIGYNGGNVKVTSDCDNTPMIIGEEGKALPYGLYTVKPINGQSLVIHKNNRGNAQITEQNNLVLVSCDLNVIDVRLQK